jgi:hypothetical protein
MITSLGVDIDKYLFSNDSLENDVLVESSLIKIYAERGDRVLLEKLMDKLEKRAVNDNIDFESEMHLMVAYHRNYYSGIIEDRDVHARIFGDMLFNFQMFSGKMAQLYHSEIINARLLRKDKFEEESNYLKNFLPIETNIKRITDLINQMLSSLNDNAYQELYILLIDSKLWSQKLRFVVFSYMTTYLNTILKTKDKSRLMDLLELYQYGVENDLLSGSKKVPFVVFSNIIGAAGKAGEHTWTRKFIKDSIQKVDVGDFSALENYAFAKLEFQIGNYETCIKLLAGFKHNSAYVEYLAFWIYFCATYEENNEHVELVKSQIISLTRFLKINKGRLTQSSVVGSLNTLKVISLSFNPNNTIKIKSFLERENKFVNSKWLLDTLEKRKILKQERPNFH